MCHLQSSSSSFAKFCLKRAAAGCKSAALILVLFVASVPGAKALHTASTCMSFLNLYIAGKYDDAEKCRGSSDCITAVACPKGFNKAWMSRNKSHSALERHPPTSSKQCGATTTKSSMSRLKNQCRSSIAKMPDHFAELSPVGTNNGRPLPFCTPSSFNLNYSFSSFA